MIAGRELLRRVSAKKAVIAVVGLGQIGLTTAGVIASKGFKTMGADVKGNVVDSLLNGKVPVHEPGLSKLVRKAIHSNRLVPTKDTDSVVKQSDIVIVCVQTPLSKEGRPNLLHLEQACKRIGKNISPRRLISVESSIPPGTTENFVAPALEAESGLKCSSDFWLAHCPERLTPGMGLAEFSGNPRIIGGYDEASGILASRFYGNITKGQLLVTDSRTAEVAKLAENAARDVDIAFANELALICERLGVDISRVISLTNSHPRVKILQPGPGVGGPCLPKDPFLLTFFAEAMGFRPKLVRAAREINDAMPEHVLELVLEGLSVAGKEIASCNIGVLGTTYKANVRDTRESPARVVVRGLIGMRARVVTFDPYVDETFGARRAQTIRAAAEGADCVVILADHEEFRRLRLHALVRTMKSKPVLVDSRRIVDPEAAIEAGFIFKGTGYGLAHRPRIPSELFRPWVVQSMIDDQA